MFFTQNAWVPILGTQVEKPNFLDWVVFTQFQYPKHLRINQCWVYTLSNLNTQNLFPISGIGQLFYPAISIYAYTLPFYLLIHTM